MLRKTAYVRYHGFMQATEAIVPRRVLDLAVERMREETVILLEGPRAVGKSTLLRDIAARRGGTLIDLDDLPTRMLAQDDPTLAIDVPGPVLIDEYKHAPGVLSAIKARLNRTGSLPGQFVLTGSSRYDTLPRTAEALTGRLHRIQVLPLAQSELRGTPGLLARLFEEGPEVVPSVLSETTRQQYADVILTGGFPDALGRPTPQGRGRWFDDYVSATLAKDVTELKKIRQAQALPRVLGALAGRTGQVLNIADIAEGLGLTPDLVAGYIKLLEGVFLVRILPAWGTTLTSRSSGLPKVHVVDTGIAARLLRVVPENLALANPTALTEFGHLTETFVVGEIIKEASWMDGIAGVGHWRTYDTEEVDLVVERDDGTVVAMEIKAGTHATKASFRGLAKMRDKLGPAFRVGVVFHMGQRGHHYDDRLIALPIDQLWGGRPASTDPLP